ncbi:ATP-binding cassette domain-containing protein [Paenibacillus sp. FSL W8-0186]|uniref:ATP-binding cassette domain-containing protein n=1 Tax=Paenibacillus sp. FSL W8-0186 TaxID=2921709 RepID=UPI0030CEEB73
MKEMIRTDGLTKEYDGKTILNDVSLTVNRGEIYGFLGLNGAGKTTIIRILLGMIKPTSGEVYLMGKKLTKGGGLWNHVGYRGSALCVSRIYSERKSKAVCKVTRHS